MLARLLVWIVVVPCLRMSWPAVLQANDLDRDEEVVFFPTSAEFDTAVPQFKFSIHGWCYEPEQNSLRRNVVLSTLVRQLGLEQDAAKQDILVDRLRPFLNDNESGQNLLVRFGKRDLPLPKTQDNGHTQAWMTLPTPEVQQMLTPHGAAAATIDFRLVTPAGDARVFSGRVHLVPPEGWSVISDVDDTIKRSNVLDKIELLRNTFFREFTAVDGMSTAYQAWEREGAVFHYLSASPWQLYPTLAEFMTNSGFPSGSWQLRYFRLQDGSAADMLTAADQYKGGEIDQLLKHFPHRKFILVGDTGERDPEIYGDAARRHPERIRLIALRNITGEALDNARMQAALTGIASERVRLFRKATELPRLGDISE